MAYTEFTVASVVSDLGVTFAVEALFGALTPVTAPEWLAGALARGRGPAMVSEKARSEFIVAPVLLAARELTGDAVAIHSGERFDVDVARRLAGECDFIITRSPPLPFITAPVLAIAEAKRNDIESGLGQVIAQMVASRIFNSRAGDERPVYGCVTTGEDWQFLKLDGTTVLFDTERYYINRVELILAALLVAVAP